MAPAGGRGRPGTEINLRTNRSCRLVPAHQGMKNGVDWWKGSRVIGALSPCRAPFTLTSILSPQGGRLKSPLIGLTRGRAD